MTPRGRWALLLAALLFVGGQVAAELEAPEWLTVHKDQDGMPFLTMVGLSKAREADVFGQIGLAVDSVPDRVLHASVEHSDGGTLSRKTTSYYRTERLLPTTEKGDGLAWLADAVEVMGHRVSVTSRQGGKLGEFEITDSLDGGRTEFHLGQGLLWAKDRVGPLVGVEYDAQGRAPIIHLGLDLVLEVVYPHDRKGMDAWRWTEKRVRTRDGRELGRWNRQDAPTPRAGARLWTAETEADLIGEWDEELYPEGVAIAPYRKAPYLLVPLNKSQEVWRSVSLPMQISNDDPSQTFSADRLDYTDREFRLWLTLDGPPGMVHQVLLSFPRKVVQP